VAVDDDESAAEPESHAVGACSRSSDGACRRSSEIRSFSSTVVSTADVVVWSAVTETVRNGCDETVPADGDRSRPVPSDGDRSRDPPGDADDGEALRRPAAGGRWRSSEVGVGDDDWWLLNVCCVDGHVTFR